LANDSVEQTGDNFGVNVNFKTSYTKKLLKVACMSQLLVDVNAKNWPLIGK
jgi:hypothetical protein